MANGKIFYFAWHARKLRYYGDVIHSFDWKSAVEHDVVFKYVIVYLVQDIPPFVMYCVYGESDSSLFIESTDSMIPHMCVLCVYTIYHVNVLYDISVY